MNATQGVAQRRVNGASDPAYAALHRRVSSLAAFNETFLHPHEHPELFALKILKHESPMNVAAVAASTHHHFRRRKWHTTWMEWNAINPPRRNAPGA
jgi:hypothetical protein